MRLHTPPNLIQDVFFRLIELSWWDMMARSAVAPRRGGRRAALPGHGEYVGEAALRRGPSEQRCAPRTPAQRTRHRRALRQFYRGYRQGMLTNVPGLPGAPGLEQQDSEQQFLSPVYTRLQMLRVGVLQQQSLHSDRQVVPIESPANAELVVALSATSTKRLKPVNFMITTWNRSHEHGIFACSAAQDLFGLRHFQKVAELLAECDKWLDSRSSSPHAPSASVSFSAKDQPRDLQKVPRRRRKHVSFDSVPQVLTVPSTQVWYSRLEMSQFGACDKCGTHCGCYDVPCTPEDIPGGDIVALEDSDQVPFLCFDCLTQLRLSMSERERSVCSVCDGSGSGPTPNIFGSYTCTACFGRGVT